MKLVLVLMALIGLAACTPAEPKDDQPDVSIPSQPNQLAFASTVPQDQANAVNEAVSALYVLPLNDANSEVQNMARLMKAPDTTAAGLQSWMQARVQYIVQDKFPVDDLATTSDDPFQYQEPGVLPDILRQTQTQQPKISSPTDSGAQTIMSNVGAGLYVEGKMIGKLVKLAIPGIGTIAMTSPRTGLLEIGPGLFPDTGGKHYQNILFDVYRLGTLFHEARHSDGHGHTVGFMHATCPYGDYAGIAACDYATNGPYTVGASVIKALMNQCASSGQCTEKTNQVLQAIYADQADRLVSYSYSTLSSDARAGVDWDDAPEGNR